MKGARGKRQLAADSANEAANVARFPKKRNETNMTNKPKAAIPAMEPMPQFMTNEDLARMLRRSVNTIRDWRRRGTGPRGVRVGKGVLYDEAEVRAWLRTLSEAADPYDEDRTPRNPGGDGVS